MAVVSNSVTSTLVNSFVYVVSYFQGSVCSARKNDQLDALSPSTTREKTSDVAVKAFHVASKNYSSQPLPRTRSVSFPTPHYCQAAQDAKKIEYECSLKAFHEGFSRFCKEWNIRPTEVHELLETLELPDPRLEVENHISRLFTAMLLPTATDETKKQAKTAVNLIVNELVNNPSKQTVESLRELILDQLYPLQVSVDGLVLDLRIKDFLPAIQACLLRDNSLAQQIDYLISIVLDLVEHLEAAPTDMRSAPGQRVISILLTLRKALQTPAYELLCCNEDHPIVSLLHTLSIATYVKSESSSAYRHLGKKLCEATANCDMQSLPNSIKKVRQTAVRVGFPEDDPLTNQTLLSRSISRLISLEKASYVSRTEDALSTGWSMLMATGRLFHVIEMTVSQLYAFLVAPFKDHRLFGNQPSVFSVENFVGPEHSRVVSKTILTPSPAVGQTLCSEFKALLQALENRRFFDISSDPFPYTCVAYTNLQSKIGGTEAECLQTEELMRQQKRFPWSFKGITISQKPFRPKNLNLFSEEVKQEMLKELARDDTFMLASEGSKSNNYIDPRDKQFWLEKLPTIVDAAYKTIEASCSASHEPLSTEDLLDDFAELVRQGIWRIHLTSLARSLMKATETVKIVQFQPCQAGVDRGPKMISSAAYALSENPDQHLLEYLIPRGILAKKRVPVVERIEELAKFLRFVPKDALRAFYEMLDHSIDNSGAFRTEGIRLI